MDPLWQNAFASLRLEKKVLLLTVLKPTPSWDEFRELQAGMRTFYAKADAKQLQVFLLFDLCHLGMLSPVMAHEWVKLFNELREVTARIVEASALVVQMPAIRAALDLFLKTYKPERPVHVCASVEEAMRWCA